MVSEDLKRWLSRYTGLLPRLYLVGGSVRDILMGLPQKDIDLVCRGAGAFASALAKAGNRVMVPMEKKPEEPCYRIVDRDESNSFIDIAEMRGSTINDDLQSRDFTVNAIAIRVNRDAVLLETIDPEDGASDIKKRLIRHIHEKNMLSDPLRMLRALRFAATLRFSIDKSTLQLIRENASLLEKVSAERVLYELLLILGTSRSADYIREMDEVGLLEVILPEIKSMKGCQQNSFHHLDVWEHSLTVMKHCEDIINSLQLHFGRMKGAVRSNISRERRVQFLKLAALLHDAGKPSTHAFNTVRRRITFYGHDTKGVEITKGVAERLRISNRDRDFLTLMVAEHMHPRALSAKETGIRTVMRWYRKVGDDVVPSIILAMADAMGTLGVDSNEASRAHFIGWLKKTVTDYHEAARERLEQKDLISGKDLIELGMTPGPAMGRILGEVREARDAGEISERSEALSMAGRLLGELI